MPYNPNNPSNWSWSRAFDEMAKTVHQGKYIELSKKKQDDLYEILAQIL